MRKSFTIYFILSMFATFFFAQENGYQRCYTMENLERLKSENPRLEEQMVMN